MVQAFVFGLALIGAYYIGTLIGSILVNVYTLTEKEDYV